MEQENLSGGRDHLSLVDDEASDGVGFVVRQVPFGGPVQVAQGHCAVDEILPVFGFGHAMIGIGVKFIGDFTYDFFEDIFEGDQALQGAVFVNHERKMRTPAQELAHLFVQRRGFRHEIGLHRHVGNFEILERGRFAFGIPDALVHCTQQVLGMDHADDIFRIIAVDRQSGVVGFEDLFKDFRWIVRGIDHLDTGAMEHHFFDHAFAQIQRAKNPVAVFLFHQPFGAAKLQRAVNLFAHREDVTVGVDGDAEQTQYAAHQKADGTDHRAEDRHDERNRTRHKGSGGFGIGDGIGFRQHFGEDQHQQGHHQRRQGHAGFAQ